MFMNQQRNILTCWMLHLNREDPKISLKLSTLCKLDHMVWVHLMQMLGVFD